MDPFLGEIRPVPYNFAPQGWAFCQGQILAIAQNTALFSLLGTNFGGNGQTTFALPDLRGRVPVSAGTALGVQYSLGDEDGLETVTLNTSELAIHVHGTNVSTGTADALTPVADLAGNSAKNAYVPSGNGTFASGAVSNAGGNGPHDNHQPYTCINYIIALQGIFPARS